MKRFTIALLLILFAATMASAESWPPQSLGWDTREGGEGPGDAVIISDLPYNDSGATCDNTHDINFSCAAQDAGAPDVFYQYTACPNTHSITIRTCNGSNYDTAIAVFTSGLGEIACNDDSCGLQSELINVPVTPGQLYYIVVSGYFTNCGNYVLDVTGEACPPTPTQGANWGHIKSMYQ